MDDDVYKFEDCPIIKASRLQATVIIYKLDVLFKDAALGLLVHRPKSPISNHTHSNIWISRSCTFCTPRHLYVLYIGRSSASLQP